jgi:hypothetical protein
MSSSVSGQVLAEQEQILSAQVGYWKQMQASTADEHLPAHATGITAAEESIYATGDIAHAGWLKHAARLANWEEYQKLFR